MKTMKTLLSASLALTALSGCQPETEKPNILFLLVDDMQSDAIAALGNKNVYTPNIDGLIAEGVTFTRTYTCLLYTSITATSRWASARCTGALKTPCTVFMPPSSTKADG